MSDSDYKSDFTVLESALLVMLGRIASADGRSPRKKSLFESMDEELVKALRRVCRRRGWSSMGRWRRFGSGFALNAKHQFGCKCCVCEALALLKSATAEVEEKSR